MKETVAKFVSGICSPFLVVIFFGLWAIAESVKTRHDFALFGGLQLLLVVGLPLLYILTHIKLGRITDIHVAVREQRVMPFVVATLGAIVLFVSYIQLDAPRQLIGLAAALIVSGVVFGIITQFWKISIHAASYTGAVIIISFVTHFHWLWLLTILPVIIWARLERKRHSPMQAIAACFVNAVCVSVALLLFQ